MKTALVSLLFAGSALACPVGDQIGTIDGKPACELKGDYTSNLSLDSGHVWVLQGRVGIGGDNANSATLTILPGAKLVGKSGPDYLLIRRGSKIMANGTASAPIVMTSAKANPSRGDWGGLVINGNAPVNGCATLPCELQGEGKSGLYGGNDANDNSGVLRFVRIEYAGHLFNDEDELNGVAFQGVGAGTTVENLQVHMANDDGVEFFGGTVNAKRVLITATKDDAFDWTYGWTGKVQFAVIQQYSDVGDRGIEADNNKRDNAASPRSNPTLANFTIIGNKNAQGGSHGVLLRQGTAVSMHNSIIAGAKKSCIDVDQMETFTNGMVTRRGRTIFNLKMENTFVHCPDSSSFEALETDGSGNQDPWSIADWFSAQTGNKAVNPRLINISASSPESNDWVPAAGSPVLGAGAPMSDSFFERVDYIGALKDRASDWTQGWTVR